jgi:ribosomal protein S18 acetylase RimI-like enzyme
MKATISDVPAKLLRPPRTTAAPRTIPTPVPRPELEEVESTNTGLEVNTRLATLYDFHEVADLRLSVFADEVHENQRVKLRAKAWEKMIERRVKGATCIVAHAGLGSAARNGWAATLDFEDEKQGKAADCAVDRADGNDLDSHTSAGPSMLVGTLECSTHEFSRVDMQPALETGARLYITELAVGTGMRRRGVALKLLRAAEAYGRNRGARALYLHVDAANAAALGLYHRAGFRTLRETVETYNFASALGLLSGNYALTKHILMMKEIDKDDGRMAPEPCEGSAVLYEADWCI